MATSAQDDLLCHAAALRRLALDLVGGRRALADDLVQETFTAALAHPPMRDRPLWPWLAQVLRNFRRAGVRGDVNREARERVAGELSPGVATPEELLEKHETYARLAALVGALAEPYRTTVLLAYVEGLEPVEIAARQGVPRGTVRWRLKTGVDELRARFDEGDRRWRLALLPLARLASGEGVLGGAFPTGVAKIACVAAALLAAGIGVLFVRDGDADRATAARAVAAVEAPTLVAASAEGATAPGSLEGLVRDTAGAPVAGAQIGVYMVDPVTTTSSRLVTAVAAGSDGRFQSAVTGGSLHVVYASAPGCLPSPATRVTVAPGRRQRIEIVLGRGGHQLTGQVLDSGGGPLVDARVRIVIDAYGVPGSGRATSLDSLRPAAHTVTDARGSYVLTVPRGEHDLEVVADGYARFSARFDVHGDQRRDVRLHPAARVAGRVVLEGGTPAAAADVALQPLGRGMLVDAKTADDGSFVLGGVAPDSYRLVARKGTHAGQATGRVDVPLAARVDGLVVELTVASSIRGHVRDDDGKPNAGALVRCEGLGLTRTARTDPQGAFFFEGVLPGRHTLTALADGRAGARLVTAVGRANVVGLELRLPRSGRIEGHVVDARGAPVADALVSGSSAHASLATVRSGAGGRFSLEGVPPGRFELWADHPHAGQAVAGPFDVVPGARLDVEVPLRSGARVHGRVMFTDGAPAANVVVTASIWNLGGRQPVTTDKDGRYTLGPFPRTAMVSIEATEERSWLEQMAPLAKRSLRIEGTGDLKDVDLQLPRAALQIRGMVHGPTGSPISGALLRTEPSGLGGPFASGPDGAFTITGLVEGKFSVFADAPGLPTATAADVEAGRSAITLRFAAPSRLGGTVKDVHGRAVVGAAVAAAPVENEGVGTQRTSTSGPDGTFRIDALPTGRFHLMAVASDGRVGRVDDVVVAPDIERGGIAVVVTGGAVVTGRVVAAADGRPIEGVHVGLRTSDRDFALGALVPEARTDSEGRFRLGGLVPGSRVLLGFDKAGYLGGQRRVSQESGADVGAIGLHARPWPTEADRPKGRLGIVFGMQNDEVPFVRDAPPGFPAAEAGLRAGDVLIAADGRPIEDLSVSGVVELLAGHPDTSITLDVRSPEGRTRRVSVRRR